jgi:hypothetical protein
MFIYLCSSIAQSHHKEWKSVKCLFKESPVCMEDGKPTVLGDFQFQGGDAIAKNIRVYSFGYAFQLFLEVSGSALPKKLDVIYVNRNDDGGRNQIENWCQTALVGPVAIDTEGPTPKSRNDRDTTHLPVDTIQIASENCGGVLFIQLGAFKNPQGTGFCDLEPVANLMKEAPTVFTFEAPTDMNTDAKKIKRALFQHLGEWEFSNHSQVHHFMRALPGEESKQSYGLKDVSERMGFPFELKRNYKLCTGRGFRGHEGKFFWSIFSCFPYAEKASLIDISYELPRNLSPTTSRWNYEARPILTLEQTTYGSLDAWITLWGGIKPELLSGS